MEMLSSYLVSTNLSYGLPENASGSNVPSNELLKDHGDPKPTPPPSTPHLAEPHPFLHPPVAPLPPTAQPPKSSRSLWR
ncbi:hypothetical protein TSUD_127530 [Trifolium subterraneum]|nr:hypothetical protein TSUD_127530 [Trifolium subterraneum]